jgi:acetyltransferase-like isoleucine patch superfamily enzyme
VIEDAVVIGDDGDILCDEVFAVGTLTHFAHRLEVRCRRAFFGTNGHIARHVRIGGGGARDPWGTFAAGDLLFLGDEAYVNPCRPVLIGREVFLTMRSVIVTHNIGHSVLEGFENRFAPVVIEDRAQIGIGTVVYAGCRIGREAIVGSNSYVVTNILPGSSPSGCPRRSPCRPPGRSRPTVSRASSPRCWTTCASCWSCAATTSPQGSTASR